MADTPRRLVRFLGDPGRLEARFAEMGVTQSAGRVGILPAGARAPDESPDVWVVTAEAPPEGFAEGLDTAEQMFVEAAQLDMNAKQRGGEGLDWDAPGRLPPDPPARI